MGTVRKKENWWSLVAVVALAVSLPTVLRMVNRTVRFWVGAEGRLAAINVEVDRVIGPMPQPWKALAQGGDRITSFLDGNEETVAKIAPAYIRIDHVFTQFEVVSRNESGLKYEWTKLDKVVEQIQKTGAKPFVALSYMPAALSKSNEVDEPRDWNEWSEVVKKTIERYSGEKAIEGVYYEVWNEPDLFGEWKIGRGKNYMNLYKYAAMGAEKAQGVKDFKLGGPATTGLYKNWMDVFLTQVLEERLRMDFFSWHRYDKDAGKYAQDVQDIEEWLDKHPYFHDTEKILSEFGPDPQKGGDNDTKLGAAHLVAVMREILYKVNWGFTFAVSGDWGVIGKPRQAALEMLGKLGDQRLSVSGEGSWVKAMGSRKGQVQQVLLVNYDPKGQHHEMVPVNFIGVSDKKYKITKTIFSGNSPAVGVAEQATNSGVLQTVVPMTPNSLVLVELN